MHRGHGYPLLLASPSILKLEPFVRLIILSELVTVLDTGLELYPTSSSPSHFLPFTTSTYPTPPDRAGARSEQLQYIDTTEAAWLRRTLQ